MNTKFEFELDEKFENLPSAPIVEAVIHWTARMRPTVTVEELKKELSSRLEDYPQIHNQQQIEILLTANSVPTGELSHSHDQRWKGIRLTSDDNRYIAQFNRDGLVFSRLQPYETWEKFSTEGMRLWAIFSEFAESDTVQRLGVRFINRIAPIHIRDLRKYLKTAPKPLDSLAIPPSDFMYSSSHPVPGYPFQINLVQTVQPLPTVSNNENGLILDIDVFTTEAFSADGNTLDEYLKIMRWLKDKVFFSLLKPSAIKKFRKGSSQ